jgi:hypothetical protein
MVGLGGERAGPPEDSGGIFAYLDMIKAALGDPKHRVSPVSRGRLFTGRWHNRVVEIGVVHVSRDGVVTGEWSTLVNPERDLGPQHIHGIHASDARMAPTFADIAGGLAALLARALLDRHLSASEQDALLDLAESLGFSLDTAMDLHRRYLATVRQARQGSAVRHSHRHRGCLRAAPRADGWLPVTQEGAARVDRFWPEPY